MATEHPGHPHDDHGNETSDARGNAPVDPTEPSPADDETVRTDDAPQPAGLRGRRIGRYTLLKELGHGGQGYVYLAEDERLGRRVALKLMPEAMSFSAQARMRFDREAEIASKLDHPGICTVFETGEDQGVPFIAMQLIEGEALDRKIRDSRGAAVEAHLSTHVCLDTTEESSESEKPTPATSSATSRSRAEVMEVVRFIEDAARALHAAHEAGLIHRDIKPGNVMVGKEGRAVILDFGLARDETSHAATLTREGDLMGTPAYMAPEQITANRIRLDRRVDVYALGATLYECVTLTRPFNAETREALYQAIQFKTAEAPRRLNPAVSKDLAVVIETAMEKDRDRRYQTALELAEELRRVRQYEPIQARPAGPLLRLRRWGQRSPATATAVTGVFLALALAAGVFFFQKQNVQRALTKEKAAVADRDAALKKERDALTEKNAALRKEQLALADYLRMSDVKRLRDAKAAAADLFPPHPDLVPILEDWQAEYRETFKNLASHEAALLRLRQAAVPYSDDDRNKDHADAYAEIAKLEAEQKAVEAKLDERESEKLDDRLLEIEDRLEVLRKAVAVRASWAFENDDLAFKHETLTQLVADLKAETTPQGVWSDVAKRLEVSRTIKAKTVDAYAAAWSEAIEGIAASPKYGELRMTPQIGLIPLGPDPASGLFEFLHWLSHEPDALLPVRNATGRFDVKEETGIILVLLPGGEFLMGAQSADASKPNNDPDAPNDESPVHAVTLDAFLIGKYEVTQAQWLRMTGDQPSFYGPGTTFGNKATTVLHPVEQVSWPESASGAGRVGLALPTEAQWEYGCRAGTSTVFSCGNEKKSLQGHANLADAFCQENGGPSSWQYDTDLNDGRVIHAPVGTYAPNGFGLFDVHGNVREWCRDEYYGYAPNIARTDDGLRLGEGSRSRVNRGGSFYNTAVFARSAFRVNNTPGLRTDALGLRVSGVITK